MNVPLLLVRSSSIQTEPFQKSRAWRRERSGSSEITTSQGASRPIETDGGEPAASSCIASPSRDPLMKVSASFRAINWASACYSCENVVTGTLVEEPFAPAPPNRRDVWRDFVRCHDRTTSYRVSGSPAANRSFPNSPWTFPKTRQSGHGGLIHGPIHFLARAARPRRHHGRITT